MSKRNENYPLKIRRERERVFVSESEVAHQLKGPLRCSFLFPQWHIYTTTGYTVFDMSKDFYNVVFVIL